MGGLCGAWLCGERHRPSPHRPRPCCEIGATGPHSRKAKFLATAPFLQKRVVRSSRRTKTKKGLGFLVSEFDAVFSYKQGLYMHVADYMSRNAIDFDDGREHHDEPGGIWMGETSGKWALQCEEVFASCVKGYDVGASTRMFKAQLTEMCDLPLVGDVEA